MIQRGDCPSLTLKAFRKSLFGNLDGNGSIETRVTGSVHFAHATGPDGVQNLVGAAARSRSKGHISSPIFYFNSNSERVVPAVGPVGLEPRLGLGWPEVDFNQTRWGTPGRLMWQHSVRIVGHPEIGAD
jgi:hypothetical protein